jgi:hypothetical protein
MVSDVGGWRQAPRSHATIGVCYASGHMLPTISHNHLARASRIAAVRTTVALWRAASLACVCACSSSESVPSPTPAQQLDASAPESGAAEAGTPDASKDASTPPGPPTPKLLLFQVPIPTADYVAAHLSEVEALPFEGLVISTPALDLERSRRVIPKSELSAQLAAIRSVQTQLKKVRHNFVDARLFQQGAFTSVTPNVVQNLANLAGAARDAGLEGIFLDNEDYNNDMWAPAIACPGKAVAECQVDAVAAGKQAMQAIVAAWPTAKVMVANATIFADAATYQEYIEPSRPGFLIMGAYAVGLSLGALGTGATFVDGGEQEFYIHSAAKAQINYTLRKNTLPMRTPLIPEAQKLEWSTKTSIAFALFEEDGPMPLASPTRWQDDIATHAKRADEYTWAFSFYHTWLGPVEAGKIPATPAWITATVAGRTAAGLPPRPIAAP